MILRPIPSPLRFQSPFLPSFPRRNPCFQWRRRRRRPPESIRPRCLLEDFFGSLLAAFPSSVSLDLLLAPALGFASGAALYLASSRGDRSGGDAVAGDWILFTSPTPFNRCVLLRCPSVSFEDGGELLEGLNDRLVTEDRHYVNLSRGRIPVARSIGDRGPQEEVSYQRFCVGTDDGGVISLDWPENLDLGREHGLDTVVIIVPGTGEGSMDRNVKSFVYVALKQGYFPVVVNPRGCAGSPLTTPRLFTAADSDDISTAIQFINKVRPWSTFMSIGWGYGANMLTKYLAEAGESTPITAAVCIDNPFDLAEATRSFPHHIALDRKLTSGLVDILQTNKELFQGKTKGFDVEKALSSTTVRDFDKAISMISYGCDDIEDFYSKISTMKMIGSLKIPLLFIQSDDGTVPLFSVPRSSIAENSFTSLLLCSCLPSTVTGRDSYTLVWCQHLAIEWFSAVELTLLKGRHPLLKDLDVTINPTKGLTIVDDRRSNNNFIEGIKESRNHDSAQLFLRHKNHSSMKFGQSNPVNGFLVDPDVAIEDKFSSSFDSESITQALGRENDEGRRDDTSAGKADNTNVAEETDSEKSQVLESASVMMNMLDVTLPGTLDDEQKKKVLTAVGRGETFMKALQGAVPEDVRGKLTNAVTEIVQTQKANLNVKGLAKLAWSKDKMKETSNTQIPNDGASVSDEGCVGNFSNNNMPEITVPSDQTANQVSGSAEIEVDDGNKLTQSSNLEKISSDVDQAGSPQKVNQPPEVTESVIVDDKVATKNTVPTPPDGDTKNNIEELNNSKSSTRSVETTLATSLNSDVNETGKEGTEIHKNENKVTQEMDQTLNSSPRPEESSPHSSSRSSSISVTQALDAITGFDDSTQMAVNSVFGVLENMIDQLEKSSNEANDNTSSGGEEKQSKILPHDHSSAEDTKSQKIACANDESLANLNVNETSEQPVDYATKEQFQSCELVKEKMVQNEVHDSLTMTGEQSSRKSHECTNQISPFKSSSNIGVGSEQKFALDIARNPYYWGSPYNAYLQKHCFSQVPTLNSIDLDMATELFLDPEEGQWKMLDLGASDNVYEDDQSQINSNQNFNQSATRRCMENFIEPSYVILETDGTQSDRQPMCANDSWGSKNDEMIHLVKNSLLDSLKVEVGRRLGISKLSEIEDYLLADIEHVADSVIQLILLNNQLDSESHANCDSSIPGKFGTIEGHHITEIISLALLDASHLKKVLPDGLIVGSVLACLRNYFELSTTSDGAQMKAIEKSEICHKKDDTNSVTGTDDGIECQSNLEARQDDTNSVTGTEECSASKFNNEDLVAGAVTAALGASAILAGHQQNLMTNDDAPLEAASVTKSWEDPHEERTKHEEAMQEKNHLSIVSSLAEKAFSVAGPVVPKKGDGEVDQERLVAVLAELGQKGGILKLVGKVALLWGGIRGAMSLTDRLISFLRIAERPLPQRILGFGFMVLVLWSPVVIPLLPTVVQSWTMPTSNRIAEYVCKIGLYVSVMILIMLWGKRIRGYDNPLDQYGLDLTMPWVHDFLKGLVGGTLIVTFVHFINGLLGISLLSWPASLPSLSAGPILVLKAYGNMILLTIQGIVTAVGIALVEELLFRSWLPEEVAVDFGFYRAIMISGITFSLIHRSLRSIPGFLMLSIALSGIKQRTMNRIHAPVGVRAGIIIASFTLQAGGFIKFKEGIPFWLINSYPMHPFDSAVGLSVAALLSIIFFPRQRQKISRDTEE